MKHCPCGSGKQYKNCCQLIHIDHRCATKPEQLMRARYSAYVLDLVEFIAASYHPDCREEIELADLQSGCELEWTKLAVKQSNMTSNLEGFVLFKAYYKDNGRSGCLEEKSRFLKVNGLWFYIDGQLFE